MARKIAIGSVSFDFQNTGEASLKLNANFDEMDRLDRLDFLADCAGMFQKLYDAVLNDEEDKLKKLLKDYR